MLKCRNKNNFWVSRLWGCKMMYKCNDVWLCVQGTQMEMISPGASLTKITNWSGTTVKLGNVLEVNTHTQEEREREILASITLICSFWYFVPSSSTHPTSNPTRSNYSQASRHSCPVLPVRTATARPLVQDLWWEEVSSWGSSMAGFPADQIQRL